MQRAMLDGATLKRPLAQIFRVGLSVLFTSLNFTYQVFLLRDSVKYRFVGWGMNWKK